MTKEEIDQLHDFYDIEIDTATASVKNILFNRLKIVRKLKEMGFYRYDTPDGNTQYVRISDNKISITREQFIIDAFEDYIAELPAREIEIKNEGKEISRTTYITAEKLLDKLYKNVNTYFSSTLDRLRPDVPIEILRDEEKKKYLFFQNIAVYVAPDGVHPVQYSDLNGYIWDSSILQHKFMYTEEKGDFEAFCENITEKDPERKSSLMSLLGYLMHDFYECDMKAVLFTDVNNDDAGNSAGGTGKGILGKALMNILNKTAADNRYCCIPAKQIDLSKDTRYSLADISTQLIHLEDIKKFNLEDLFNDITDGATIRRPYQIKPIVKFVKMMISVNHTIELEGSSKKRRIVVFELANFYNERHTPTDDFPKRFFESKWNDDDWTRFYSFMCRCAQVYMQRGIIPPKEINYSFRAMREKNQDDFLYWIDSIVDISDTKHEQRYEKNKLYQDFITRYPDYSKHSQRKFTKWCTEYFDTKCIPYVELRSTNDIFVLFPHEDTKNIHRIREAKLREKPVFDQDIEFNN